MISFSLGRSLIVISLTSIACSACQPGEREFRSLCEAKLSNRLKFPATYRTLSFEPSSEQVVTWQEYIKSKIDAGLSPNKLETMIVERLSSPDSPYRDRPPKLFDIEVAYESRNAFNVPIRAKAVCRQFSISGDFSDIKVYGDIAIVSDVEF